MTKKASGYARQVISKLSSIIYEICYSNVCPKSPLLTRSVKILFIFNIETIILNLFMFLPRESMAHFQNFEHFRLLHFRLFLSVRGHSLPLTECERLRNLVLLPVPQETEQSDQFDQLE